MSIKQARIEGGRTFREQWGVSLLVILLAYAGVVAATVAVFGLGGLIVEGPLFVGVYYVYYQAVQGNRMNWKDIFWGFKTNFGEIVLGTLIKAAFFAGIGAAAASLVILFGLIAALVPVLGIILIFLVYVAAIVAFIIFGLYLSAVEYILMREPETKGWEAVKKSKRIMTGNIGRYFGFCMSFIGWMILTAIFFPLAIYTFPYFYMSKMYFIGSIYDEAERRASEPAPVYTAPEPAAPFVAADAPAAEAPVKFCKHCGSPLPVEAAFCSKCGGAQNETVAAEVKEEVKETVFEKAEEVKETAEEVKETAVETAEETKDTAAETITEAAEEIKEKTEE